MSHTVLIVDDEPAIREALRRALRHEPYAVIEAGGGAEALEILSAGPVDVVLSDYNMPGMTGLALFHKVQALGLPLIRILLTGQADHQLATQALDAEVVYHVLQKPWDRNELILLLHLALRHLAMLRENERLLGLIRTQRRIIADLEQGRPGPA